MRMRKKIMAMVLVAGMTAASLTACSTNVEVKITDNSSTTAAETTAAQVTTAAETTAAETAAQTTAAPAQTTAAATTAAETTAEEIPDAITGEEVTYEHPLGFRVRYETEYFDMEATDVGMILTYNKDDYNNYMSIQYLEEYSQEDLKNGLVLQAPTEDVLVEERTFASTDIPMDVIMYQTGDDYTLQFNIVPYLNGCLMIEMGAHHYIDDDLVSGLIAEMYNTIEL